MDADGPRRNAVREGDALIVRAGYTAATAVAAPVFQVAIVDVDTGLVVATATSSADDVPPSSPATASIECRFDSLAAARRRQYVLRLTITDAHQLMSYDVVTAGPRFAVTAGAGAPSRTSEDEDGLISLPYRFEHRRAAGAGRRSMSPPPCSSRFRTAARAGNMLRHGLIPHLLGGAASLRVVVVSPLTRDERFVREFAHPRVSFEDLPAHRPLGLEARIQALMQACYLESGITESVRIRRAEAQAKGTIRWIGPKARLARLIAPSLARPETRYDVSDRRVSHAGAETLFDTYAPSLLVTSSPGLIFSEVPLLRTAVRRGVRAMAIDPSWDNFTNKLLPVRRVDRLLVWNELMRQQAVDWHGYRPDMIRVCGAPQFDGYFRSGPRTPREEFFRRIGADPGRKLITLTTTPRELYPHHVDVVRVLSRAIETGALARPSQVLVRLHPRDDEDAYREVRHVPHVIIEKPFRPTVKVDDGLAVDVMPEHQRHLADTMRHSDVVVNVASTIAIEACVFDTPVVNIAFDGDTDLPYERSARRYYTFTHYVNITRHNAVRVAWTPGEMTEHISRYLADPALDAEGRRRVVAEQCQFLDGRSGERVAAAVADELADALGRPLTPAAGSSRPRRWPPHEGDVSDAVPRDDARRRRDAASRLDARADRDGRRDRHHHRTSAAAGAALHGRRHSDDRRALAVHARSGLQGPGPPHRRAPGIDGAARRRRVVLPARLGADCGARGETGSRARARGPSGRAAAHDRRAGGCLSAGTAASALHRRSAAGRRADLRRVGRQAPARGPRRSGRRRGERRRHRALYAGRPEPARGTRARAETRRALRDPSRADQEPAAADRGDRRRATLRGGRRARVCRRGAAAAGARGAGARARHRRRGDLRGLRRAGGHAVLVSHGRRVRFAVGLRQLAERRARGDGRRAAGGRHRCRRPARLHRPPSKRPAGPEGIARRIGGRAARSPRRSPARGGDRTPQSRRCAHDVLVDGERVAHARSLRADRPRSPARRVPRSVPVTA